MTRASLVRKILAPASVFACSLALFLAYTACVRDLERVLQAPACDCPTLGVVVQAYHARPDAPRIHHTLSRLLTDQPLKRRVFAFLLAHRPPEQSLPAYLHRAPVGPVRGFAEGASHIFGLPHRDLTTGEILLLCDLSVTGAVPAADPLRAIKRRDALLSEVQALGLISESQYQRERSRALSLPPDHRPIY